MDWNSPYIVYRIGPDNRLEEVFHADDIKRAKYWLTYIAKPGDVLCKTPAHPKHSQETKVPEYWSHKEFSGRAITNELAWRKLAEKKASKVEFPAEQLSIPNE